MQWDIVDYSRLRIYRQFIQSFMFQISDVLIDKEKAAMVLDIKISLPDEEGL